MHIFTVLRYQLMFKNVKSFQLNDLFYRPCSVFSTGFWYLLLFITAAFVVTALWGFIEYSKQDTVFV